MLHLKLFGTNRKPKILCLGAHSDDIEIGCGGSILRIIKELPLSQFRWIVFSGTKPRAQEARQSASFFLNESSSQLVEIHNYKQSYFPFIGSQIKDSFENLKTNFSPDLIFTHYSSDAHQDHKLISNLTWNTFRNNLILEYEIPKYDGDLHVPNFYIHLDKPIVEKKINLIYNTFHTQKDRAWFSKDTFKSIMRIRGVESNSDSKYAEAFHCRKICF